MAITNGYTTLDKIKPALGIQTTDTTDDTALEIAVDAASRQIDAHCGKGRRFWQDGVVVARSYFPTNAQCLGVDDISTTTGLIVKVDDDDDGTFETTLTINTDFILLPLNAASEYPVRPWTTIQLLRDGTLGNWTQLGSGRPHVQVTARFGWSAVPNEIERACVLQARSIFKSEDTTFGFVQNAIDGTPMRVPPLHPMAKAQLEPFIRYDEVDDGA